MSATNPKLLNLFSEELPIEFLKQIKGGFEQIYKEAYHRGYDDPAWDAPEANYLVPHFRRALIEKLVRDSANSNGLSATVMMNRKRTSEYTIISSPSSKFLFTISHCVDRSQVRHARFRQQNSQLNSLLSQGRFEEFDTAEILQGNIESIYAILIHGVNFIEFAIPDTNGRKWLDCYKLDDLIDMKSIGSNAISNEDDRAFPTFKRNRKSEEG